MIMNMSRERVKQCAVCIGVGVALAAVASCGGKSPPAQTEGTAAAASETTLPAGLTYKDMTKDQRALFMQQTVMPTMKPLFQEFDAKAFAQVTCRTCHGSGVTDKSFAMPNADLPRLPAMENFPAFAQDPKHAPWVQFMAQKVKPTMAKLLAMSEFDPATNSGEFSCHACHLSEGETPAAK
jgi:hypothetical protein